MLGLGRDRIVRVPVDGQGRMRADTLPAFSGPTIVCVQAGNVNTGAFDPIRQVCAIAQTADAWVHVDAAFGLWAAVAPSRAYLVDGVNQADSWATDAHKWLNVPYDSGIAFVKNAADLKAAMAPAHAGYFVETDSREPAHYAPEMSRRARGIEIWAALKSLGRSGLAEMVERTCSHARQFADGLRGAGYDVPNEVVLNQVLVSFGDDARTRRVIAAIQAEGTCWCGPTLWQDKAYMRISVSSWATTEEDVELSLDAMLRVASETP
jgi:glutamate/tyrosine decarboxylase-like PLP-dependent enzyme